MRVLMEGHHFVYMYVCSIINLNRKRRGRLEDLSLSSEKIEREDRERKREYTDLLQSVALST